MIPESQIKLNYYIYLNLIGIIFFCWLINHYVYDDNLSFGIITGIYDPFIFVLGSIGAIFSHSTWGHITGNLLILFFCMPFICRYLSTIEHIILFF